MKKGRGRESRLRKNLSLCPAMLVVAELLPSLTLYREMDMRFWLEKAEPALRPSYGKPP